MVKQRRVSDRSPPLLLRDLGKCEHTRVKTTVRILTALISGRNAWYFQTCSALSSMAIHIHEARMSARSRVAYFFKSLVAFPLLSGWLCVANPASVTAQESRALTDTALADTALTDSALADSALAPRLAIEPSPALDEYVSAADDTYAWELRDEFVLDSCEVLRLHLVSQTWQGIQWKHVLHLIKPPKLDTSRTDALLLIGGGSWKADWPANGPDNLDPAGEARLLASVATQFGCVIAVLSHVPFQPMMDGKHEDEIIAATFAKYIQTQDPTWPLLLPMVKSAVRGMDATTAAAMEQWQVELKEFTVTGASKRGWTTWLTGAYDARATAIAPMVIDMLNMRVQMQHQLGTWGKYSEEIADYTALELPNYLATPEGKSLQNIVDPFSYRTDLQQPKLLIFGTNDRYWPLDACNNYWNELSGDKHLLYVPNQGHGIKDYVRLIGSLSALHRSVHGGVPLPKMSWDFAESPTNVELELKASGEQISARGWVAKSATKDFRDAEWLMKSCKSLGDQRWQLAVEKPAEGYVACFAEIVCEGSEMPAFFSTNVKIFESVSEKPDAPQADTK